MFKKILLCSLLGVSSLFAMDEDSFEQYMKAYQSAYQLGVAAIQKCASAGFANARVLAITMLMKKEQQKEQSAEFKPRMAAFTDLLQQKPSKF